MGLSDLEPVLAVLVQALESQILKTYCSLVKDEERMYELELCRATTVRSYACAFMWIGTTDRRLTNARCIVMKNAHTNYNETYSFD